jgi:OOP family OmpA-OmpF porin
LFIRDTAWLSPSSRETLNRLAAYLKRRTDLQVVLTGHTDDLGPLGVNKTLSLQRATHAQTWLVDRGVDSAQTKVMNFAAAKPVAQGRTAEARAQNRRVEITVRGRDR